MVSGTSGKAAEAMGLRRRMVLGVIGISGLLGVVGACGRSSGKQVVGNGGSASPSTAAGASSVGQAASPPAPTAAPSWRGSLEIPLEPDFASRSFSPTAPQGDVVDIEGGLKVTVPKGSKVTPVPSDNDVSETVIELPGAEYGLPRLLIDHVKSFGRSLAEETLTQEVLLSTEKSRSSYVYRSREQWPGAKEAIAMSWSSSSTLQDGQELPVDVLAFWLADDAGGGWVLYATAPKGELHEGAPLWDSLFSAQAPA